MEQQLPSNKKFGFFFAVIFLFLALYFYNYAGQALALSSLSISVFFLLVALFFDTVLLPLNKLWMKFGFLLGKIVSPLIMGVIFFILFVPIGLIMRLFGRDELRLKMNSSDTHWKSREDDGSGSDSFKYQF